MKAQRLKGLSDFLKRAEIIPQALLIITDDDFEDCERAISDLRSLNYELPFYELNLSENPDLRSELEEHFNLSILPTFIYFRGTKVVSQITGFSPSSSFTDFLTSAILSDY
jgi:thioredoxin-related protein